MKLFYHIKKALCFLLCFGLLFPLAGCGKSSALLRYDISAAPQNLDPQFATGAVEQMIIQNICEGLVRQLPNGEIVPALAESYAISESGLQYTFILKEAQWENGAPVTAEDFVFAFQRMFNSVSRSPYAEQYASISGARQIMEAGAAASSLGVSAKDSRTLVFTLAQEDPFFWSSCATRRPCPATGNFLKKAGENTALPQK